VIDNRYTNRSAVLLLSDKMQQRSDAPASSKISATAILLFVVFRVVSIGVKLAEMSAGPYPFQFILSFFYPPILSLSPENPANGSKGAL